MKRFPIICSLLLAAMVLCSCGSRLTTKQPPAKPLPPAGSLQSEQQLCANVGIDTAACADIRTAAKTKLTPLPRMSEDGFEGKPVGVRFEVPYQRTDTVLRTLRARVKPRGCVAFVSEQKFGFGGAPDKIAIMKTGDQFDILRVCATSAPNFDIDNAAVIAKLKDWEKRYPFQITAAACDSATIVFEDVPSDLDAFAKEVYEFCPDIVDQGCGSVDELAKEIRKDRTIPLWWD